MAVYPHEPLTLGLLSRVGPVSLLSDWGASGRQSPEGDSISLSLPPTLFHLSMSRTSARGGGAARVAQWLAVVVVMALIDKGFCWHAWLGQEALPTLPGTSLESSLDLPKMTPSLDLCDMALTSLKKVISGRVCLQKQPRCHLPCAVAWGSLLRDFEHITDMKCESVKQAIQAWQPSIIDQGFGRGTASLVSLEEGGRLADMCSIQYKCPDNHCKRNEDPVRLDGTSSRPEFSSLAPPSHECPTFAVVHDDAGYMLPFLTWHSLHHRYLARALGCSGGLSNETADVEHTTWACIHQPSCITDRLPRGDLACFKYSHIRGEFHFWGWNRDLALTLPLFTVEVSFCVSTELQPGMSGTYMGYIYDI